MVVPCLVEDSMVAGLDDARGEVNIPDVLIRGGVPKEDAGKVMSIQLGTTLPSLFNTDLGAKNFKVTEVRRASVPGLKWGLEGHPTHAAPTFCAALSVPVGSIM